MKQENYTAILLKATDWKESDKLVRLFTVEGGIINAVMKGVKKSNAKLKFGAQPFAFCEYNIAEGKGFNTVTGCVPIEDFFALTQDVDKFMCASVMIEAVGNAVSDLPDPTAFILLLKSLKETLYGETDPRLVLVKFLQTLILRGGYEQKLEVKDGEAGPLSVLSKIQNSKIEQLSYLDCGETLGPLLRRSVKTFEKHYPPGLRSAKLL